MGLFDDAFLGVQVALFSVALGFLSYLIFFGYKVADRAFDAFERGKIVGGSFLLGSALLFSVGGSFLLLWLVFGSGLAPSVLTRLTP